MKYGAAFGSSVILVALVLIGIVIAVKWIRCCRSIASIDARDDKVEPK